MNTDMHSTDGVDMEIENGSDINSNSQLGRSAITVFSQLSQC